MAQHDYVIANGTGAAVRSDINNALAAIVSQNSGSTEPATTYAYMMWPDTTAGVMKMRNGANSAWITLYQLDGEWSTIAFENGTAAAPSIYFKDSGTDTGFYSPGANQVGISTGGTAALVIDSSQRVGLGTSSVSYKLHLVESGTSANYVVSEAGSFQAVLGTQNSPGVAQEAFVGTLSNSDFKIKTNNSEIARFTTSGRLGIGTTPDSFARLHVSNGGAEGYEFQVGSVSANTNRIFAYNRSTSSYISSELLASQHLFSVAAGEAARIDSSRRLLVGTSTSRGAWYNTGSGEDATLQVEGGGGNAVSLTRNVNSASGAYLNFGKSRGTTNGSNTVVQSGDILGTIDFQGADGSEMVEAALIKAEVDGTPGSNDMPGRLVFSTTADGASSPTERMRITAGNEILFGKTVSSQTSNNGVAINNNSSKGFISQVFAETDGGSTTLVGYSTGDSSYKYYFRANGGLANYSANNINLSDEREKKNIEDLSTTWDCLKHWKLKKFHYNQDKDQTPKKYGVIAQQVQVFCPEVISEWKEQEDENGSTITRLAVKEQQMMWMAIKALQEAQLRIETLEAEVAALKSA
jgi:hypothetical protein